MLQISAEPAPTRLCYKLQDRAPGYARRYSRIDKSARNVRQQVGDFKKFIAGKRLLQSVERAIDPRLQALQLLLKRELLEPDKSQHQS